MTAEMTMTLANVLEPAILTSIVSAMSFLYRVQYAPYMSRETDTGQIKP